MADGEPGRSPIKMGPKMGECPLNGLVEGKILTGNHGFYHQIEGCPVNFPIIQFYDCMLMDVQRNFMDVQKMFKGFS